LSASGALAGVLGSLEQLPAIAALRGSVLAYPLVNALHLVGVALLFGAIVPLDLRLAGWRRDTIPVDRLARVLLPVAVAGLLIAACAGLLLFATDARAYAASPLFRAKILLIGVALLNALGLRAIDWRGAVASAWPMRVAGAASLLLWLGVLVLGRLVGYF
jgi:hypothetical protein